MAVSNSNIFFIKCILLLGYFSTTLHAQNPTYAPNGGGRFDIVHKNIGISAGHMMVNDNNEVHIIDRTDVGPSGLKYPGPCKRKDKLTGKPDCSAHALLFYFIDNSIRPLFINTDTYGSSGSVRVDGALVQSGGTGDGFNQIRLFKQCDDHKCDWTEVKDHNLTFGRRFATSAILPDARFIVVGGQDTFNYEFLPKDSINPLNQGYYDLPLLKDSFNEKGAEDNLYPFVHLLPDGNVYIFANQKSVVLDHVNNKVVKTLPDMPGESRNFPSTGSSALLPLRLPKDPKACIPVEVMICGGAAKGNALKASKEKIFLEASRTCGRLVITSRTPQWKMEDMPMPRVMSDLINLPSGDMLLINGAQKGVGGWGNADEPALNPLLYKPDEVDPKKRFLILNPSPIPRMYHSTAVLLTDGRVLVGGSNPQEKPTTGGKFPTEYRLEAFYPEYLARQFATRRPRWLVVDNYRYIRHGGPIKLTFDIRIYEGTGPFKVMLFYPSCATHSNQMNQKMWELSTEKMTGKKGGNTIMATAPANSKVAPPGWYIIYVVHNGLPSNGRWLKLTSPDSPKEQG